MYFISFCSVAWGGKIWKEPGHQAIEEGEKASLICQASVPSTEHIQWTAYYEAADTGTLLYDSETGDVTYDGYDVITRTQYYELVIQNVTKDMGGFYECSFLNANERVNGSLLVMSKY